MVVGDQERQRVHDPADERADAGDRPANDRIPSAGELAGVREALGEGHRDACAERCREPRDECVVRLVRDDRDGKDRRERRERAVDQSDHRRLDALQEKGMTVGHEVECSNRVASW